MFAPAATPAAIVNRLNEEVGRILNRPEVKARLLGVGAEPMGGSPAELGAKVKSEMVRLGKVIKDAGIRGQ